MELMDLVEYNIGYRRHLILPFAFVFYNPNNYEVMLEFEDVKD